MYYLIKYRALVVILLLLTATIWAGGTKEESAPSGAEPSEFELWHYWGAGGELEALNALVDTFKEKHPEIQVKLRTIPSGSEMRRQLSASFMGGDPPEVFTYAPGYGIKTYADVGRLEPITDVWDKIDGDKIFPKGLAAVNYYEGEAWSIPVNIHTLNAVWYNVSVFNEHALQPPKSWEDYSGVAQKLKANDIAPTTGALRGPWAVYTLYPFLVETIGARGYRDLGRGEISFNQPELKKAFELYKENWIENLVQGWSGYGWVEAVQPFMDGKAGMYFCMGDWAAALMQNQGMTPIEDFDFFFAPGTSEMIIGQVDTFALTKGSNAPIAAKLFLEHVASIEGQRAFNKHKGSLASNLKVKPDLYGPIHTKIYRTLNASSTQFLPNQVFLMSPDFYSEFRQQIEKYATNPTPETLEAVLNELEGFRLEEHLADKWAKWEW